MQSSKMEERRRFSRVPFDATVTVSGTHGSWTGKLIDISLKGVLITRPHAWPSNPGENLLVEVHPPHDPFTIRMEMNVAHSHGEAIGFECLHIDIDSVTHLRRLVELNVGDESILHRELIAMTKGA